MPAAGPETVLGGADLDFRRASRNVVHFAAAHIL